MKISVVIPAHNEEKFIGETLKAVLAQDYPNFEVIVVNNASTDKTSHVVRTFPNVKLVEEPRKGLLLAREAGRKQAIGEIIVNTDADCSPQKDWLSKGVSYFKSPDIVAVTGPLKFPDAGPIFRFIIPAVQKTIYGPLSRLLQAFSVGAVLIGGNNFIRASALNAMGGYDTSIAFHGEDADTGKKLSKIGRVKFVISLAMDTSSRRFVQTGAFFTSYMYVFNFFWVTFFKKPYKKVTLNAKNLLTKELTSYLK